MSSHTAKILLITVILARSTSFLCSKLVLDELAPFAILGIRFTLAFFILALLFGKRLYRNANKKTLYHGCVLGGSLFLVMGCEMLGLRETDSYMVAFLENMALVFVPFLVWGITKKRPGGKVWAAVVIILAGVGLLTLKGGAIHLGEGELYSLAAAFFYALFIVLTGRMVENDDPLTLGILQMGALGVMSLAVSFAEGTLALPQTMAAAGEIAYLAIICSAFGFAFQTVAKKYMTAETAGMLCALNPLFAAIWGSLFLGETLGAASLLGAALVVTGIVVVNRE